MPSVKSQIGINRRRIVVSSGLPDGSIVTEDNKGIITEDDKQIITET